MTFIPEHRNDIPLIFKDSTELIAVEVGTHQAVYASEFMKLWKGFLHLVDPWKDYDSVHPTFYPNFQEHTQNRDQDMKIAIAIMQPYSDRCSFHKRSSVEAASIINAPDIVYIDALHDYNSIKQDMNLWWEKLNENGWLCGHDYREDVGDVIKAVDEFVMEHKTQLFITSEELPSWMIPKTRIELDYEVIYPDSTTT